MFHMLQQFSLYKEQQKEQEAIFFDFDWRQQQELAEKWKWKTAQVNETMKWKFQTGKDSPFCKLCLPVNLKQEKSRQKMCKSGEIIEDVYENTMNN